MRFAGCCNISCKRIDAVEHSDDLGASRKGRNLPTSEKQSTLEKIASPLRRGSKKLQQSNAPGPKDLDALACRLAERGADVAGDPEGVRVTFPVPDSSRRSSLNAATTMATDMIAVTGATKSSQAPSTVYLRVCDRVADKKDLAKQWAEALAAGAEKQQPLGGYRGEDVAAKNPFTKALAARGRLAVAS